MSALSGKKEIANSAIFHSRGSLAERRSTVNAERADMAARLRE
jgi:hypothetical protein